MPTARVGAMPPTPAFNDQHGHGHGAVNKKSSKERRKQKGITMEDLKQQTAGRLAKEQRRRNAVTANRNARGKILSQDPHQRKPRLLNANPSLDQSPSCDNSIGSSSFHSNSIHGNNIHNSTHNHNNNHHPAFSQNQNPVDDFPHGTFDFVPKNNTHNPVTVTSTSHPNPMRHHQQPEMQQQHQHSPNMQVYVKHQPHNHQPPHHYHPSHHNHHPAAQNLTPHKSHGHGHGNGHYYPGQGGSHSQYPSHTHNHNLGHKPRDMTQNMPKKTPQQTHATSHGGTHGGGGGAVAAAAAAASGPGGGSGSGASSNSSKLPHGLTVQELKEMTRARLAAEAAENNILPTDSTDTDLSTQVHNNTNSSTGQSQGPRQRVFSQDSISRTSQINNSTCSSHNRQPILSTDSFGSSERQRQRLGSVESFGSTASAAAAAFTNSGYHQRSFLTPSMSNDHLEQPSVSSFSYDAMDNESLTSGLGSESFFGSDTVASRTTKYSTNSSVYKLPYSSSSANNGSPSSHGTKLTTNIRSVSDGWNGHIHRATASSPSSVPTVAQSVGSFGASDNENGSSFFAIPSMPSMPAVGKLERLVSAGAVVPNSVAESVLGFSEDNDHSLIGTGTGSTDVFHDYEGPSIVMSPNTTSSSHQGKTVGGNTNDTPYTFPWSTTKSSETKEVSGNDNLMSGLQSEWNSLLHIAGRNNGNGHDNSPDDFPLTFHSKGSAIGVVSNEQPTSPENHYYSSPFQPVPEERVIQNLVSRDVNVPENFLDDHNQDLTLPKLGNRMRRKKSRS